MKYIPSFPIDYNAITVFIGFDRVDQLGQPIQREVDRKNTDYIIFGVPERYRIGGGQDIVGRKLVVGRLQRETFLSFEIRYQFF